MKHFLTALCTLLFWVQGIHSTVLTTRIDERIELASYLSRYVGFDRDLPIDGYYFNYVDRQFVSRTKGLLLSDNIYYFMASGYEIDRELLLSAALTWKIDSGHIVQDADKTNRMRQTWPAKEYDALMGFIDQFYRQTRFGEFFTAQKPLYDKAKELYDSMALSGFHTGFLDSITSAPADSITLYISLLSYKGNIPLLASDAVVVNGFMIHQPPKPENVGFSPDALWIDGLSGDDVIYPLLCSLSELILYGGADTQRTISRTAMEYYKSAMYLFDRAHVSPEDIIPRQMSQLAALAYLEMYHADILDFAIIGDTRRGFFWENELYRRMKKLRSADNFAGKPFKEIIDCLLYELKTLTGTLL